MNDEPTDINFPKFGQSKLTMTSMPTLLMHLDYMNSNIHNCGWQLKWNLRKAVVDHTLTFEGTEL